MISPSPILYAINGNAPRGRLNGYGDVETRTKAQLQHRCAMVGAEVFYPYPSKRLQRFAPQVGETYGAKTRLVWEDDPRENDRGQYTDYLFDFNQNHIPHCGPLQKRYDLMDDRADSLCA